MSRTVSVVRRQYYHSIKKGTIRLVVEVPDILLTPEERKRLALNPGALTLVLWDFKQIEEVKME